MIPALRERLEDLSVLAEHFFMLGRAPEEVVTVAPNLIARMKEYRWPGNVRELRNVIERIRVLTSDKDRYTVWDWEQHAQQHSRLSIAVNPKTPATANEDNVTATTTPPPSTSQLNTEGRTTFRRKKKLRELFDELGELKVSEAAALLEVSRSTASRYLRELCQEGVIEKITPTNSRPTHYYAKCKE